jgi:oxygen-independent coproporphyrinogen-3 oxidase
VADDWKNAGFGIYIHWPFCQSKCPYCDFNSHVHRNVDQKRWAKAFQSEISYQASLTTGRTVDTIFFGGGTPSLMDPDTVSTILESIARNWELSDAVEISLEANPTSVEANRFQAYAQAGVNRLSMGIQSLDDQQLKALGRLHTAQEAMQAFDIAKLYFDNVSFDLIYARQNQTRSMWERELNTAIELAVNHLSLYQLTIEPNTRFGELQSKGRLRDLPSDQTAVDMYQATQDICGAAGLSAYEVSNHARSGSESRHNLIYWRYGDYAGIGPGAHGRLSIDEKRFATESPLMPEQWLATVEKSGSAMEMVEDILPEDQFAEYLMMSLRLSEGSELDRLQKFDKNLLDMSKLQSLAHDGFLTVTNSHVIATEKGRIILNTLLAEILNV